VAERISARRLKGRFTRDADATEASTFFILPNIARRIKLQVNTNDQHSRYSQKRTHWGVYGVMGRATILTLVA
jgi:hypothetical protein